MVIGNKKILRLFCDNFDVCREVFDGKRSIEDEIYVTLLVLSTATDG